MADIKKENKGINWRKIGFWAGVGSTILGLISVGASLKADSEE